MSISDELMYKYYLLITNENLDEIKKEHPKKMKQKLANIILTKFYSKNIAEQSEQEFEKVFSAKELPSNIEEFRISEKEMKLSELLVKSKLVTSKKEAERMIQQGGVKINEQKVSDDKVIKIENSILIQVGKRKFKKIIT